LIQLISLRKEVSMYFQRVFLLCCLIGIALCMPRDLTQSNKGDIWSICGPNSDHLHVKTVSITPDPPAIGQDLTVQIQGTLDETIVSGTVHLELAVFRTIILVNTTYSLCTLISKFMSCPLKQGAVNIKVQATIPSEAPAGPYTGKVHVYDQNDSEVICVDLKFTMKPGNVISAQE